MSENSILLANARAYCQCKDIRLFEEPRLGWGSDGDVWNTSRPSAVKAVNREENYKLERECYRRLKAKGVSSLGIFAVPELIDWDDHLQVIEMSIVQPPYLLDFGKVHLDRAPTHLYDAQMMKNAYAEWRARFGDQWTEVAFVIELLKKYGIYYYDPRPSNIDTGVTDDDDDIFDPHEETGDF